MQTDVLLEQIDQKNTFLRDTLGFENIRTNQLFDFVRKVVDVSLESHKKEFRTHEGSDQMDYPRYVAYVEDITRFLIDVIYKEQLSQEMVCELNTRILSCLPMDHPDRISAGKLRGGPRMSYFLDEKGNPTHLDYFVSHNKVPKLFTESYHVFSRGIEASPFHTIIHFCLVNLSKIHPFMNANGRTFNIIRDVLLIRHGFLPIFLLQDKSGYDTIVKIYMHDKNFERFKHNFFGLILDRYTHYQVQ